MKKPDIEDVAYWVVMGILFALVIAGAVAYCVGMNYISTNSQPSTHPVILPHTAPPREEPPVEPHIVPEEPHIVPHAVP